jgi:HAD superfamily hydrolase (TIGR01490 family)
MKKRLTCGRIAAFFDLDGTLISGPSVEQRFFANLRHRRAIPLRNYFLWLLRAAWLAPQGMEQMRHANKMYLRGVCASGCDCEADGEPSKLAAPQFFLEGVDQMAWHARQGHAIVLVSGTVAPLAQEMALALTVRLAVRGIAASVAVCATRLEESEGRWTGRIAGDAIVGEAKRHAVRRLAKEEGFDLARCYAYGDSAADLAMLEAVGRPCVVNPAGGMEKLARRRDWAVLVWADRRRVAPNAPTAQTRDEVLETR